jgi:fucose permease
MTRLLDIAPENAGLLAVIYGAFLNSGMMSILQGSLLPYLREEHGLSYAQSGLMLSAHQIGNLAAVLLAGALPYWIGRKKSALLLGPGIVAGLALAALTGNPVLLVAAYALTGISRGTMSNVCNSTVSMTVGNRAAGSNLLHASFAVGALLAPLLLLLGERFSPGWRAAPYAVAASALVVFVLLGRSRLSGEPVAREKTGALTFLRSASFWLNTGVLFFYLCAEASIVGWFVLYFTDTGLLTPEMAGITPSLLWLMILAGRLLCAALSAKLNRHILSLILGLLFAGFFGALLLAETSAAAFACLLGIGLSMGGIYPTTFACIDNTSSAAVTGTVIAVATVGAVVMPGVVGAVAESRGLAWGIGAVLFALAAMVALMAGKAAVFVKKQPCA